MPLNRQKFTPSDAECVAIQALGFLSENPESLRLFLDLSGLSVTDFRARLSEPAFLVGVLDFILSDESLLLRFAETATLDPVLVGRAHDLLDR